MNKPTCLRPEWPGVSSSPSLPRHAARSHATKAECHRSRRHTPLRGARTLALATLPSPRLPQRLRRLGSLPWQPCGRFPSPSRQSRPGFAIRRSCLACPGEHVQRPGPAQVDRLVLPFASPRDFGHEKSSSRLPNGPQRSGEVTAAQNGQPILSAMPIVHKQCRSRARGSDSFQQSPFCGSYSALRLRCG